MKVAPSSSRCSLDMGIDICYVNVCVHDLLCWWLPNLVLNINIKPKIL